MFKPTVIIAGVILFWFGLRWFERANLYFPDRQLIATPAQVGMAFEDVWMTASDGVKIHGWFIPSPGRAVASSPTLLFCHGNAGNISHRLDKAARLISTGANVFLFDYRGYGQSSGGPSEKGMYRDAEAAYQYLTATKGLRDKSIILYGESLGGGVAVETALRYPSGGLILESAFTSTVDMARLVFPFLPVRWMVREKYDSLAKISRLAVPVLVLHSAQDEIVPFAMGERLYAAAGGAKLLVELTGDHNEGYIDSGKFYQDAVASFIRGKSS